MGYTIFIQIELKKRDIMKEIQTFAEQFQKEMGWEINDENYLQSRASLLNNYMLLTTEISEVAEELRKCFNYTHKLIHEGIDEDTAFKTAKSKVRENIGKEFADCLAYICKIANYYEIDLEQSFYSKMEEVKNRQNKDIGFLQK